MPNEFYGNETLLISHETPAFSLLTMSAKLMIFNIMKSFIKLSLKLALSYRGVCTDERVGATKNATFSFNILEARAYHFLDYKKGR